MEEGGGTRGNEGREGSALGKDTIISTSSHTKSVCRVPVGPRAATATGLYRYPVLYYFAASSP